jgi:hypothetical protein
MNQTVSLIRNVATKRNLFRKGLRIASVATLWLLIAQSYSFAELNNQTNHANYFALPLSANGNESNQKVIDRYGIPFVEGILPLDAGGSARVEVGAQVERLFLLGMTDANKLPGRMSSPARSPSEIIRPAIPADGWADPRDESVRFFIGDELGQIRLEYADGSTQVFPLLLGEGVWWGRAFYDYPEPFPTDARLRKAFASAMRLYPPAPVIDGKYIAEIVPLRKPIRSITFENNPAKKGTLVISGITAVSGDTNAIAAGIALSPGILSSGFATFAEQKALRPLGEDKNQDRPQLEALRRELYSSDESFEGHIAPKKPARYSGPDVLFEGNLEAEVLANAFYYNVRDIADKIGKDGMYHTSTKDALSWGGYKGFGTFRKNLGRYYDDSYSRDMGRSLQELTMVGDTTDAARCADYSLQKARLWETDPSLKINGIVVPPHWGMFVNSPRKNSFENDGHGLTTLFLYKLWQRIPNRDQWLRSRWPDIKGVGDWILWQFDHPEISGATNGLLHTTGESANGKGYSVYPDCICMDALQALAQMADSIGENQSAEQWRQRADKMRLAISSQYIIDDPKYGRVWTLDHAGWADKSTVLGPLIFLADYQGFAPEDDNPDWRPVNEAAYQRLIDTYKPFGFYGQAMGYGQGFVTESALLLDRMRDATEMLDWAAKQIYDPRFGSFIVPEGCQIDPTGRFWYRIGDLGNGVQEGEIVKALRLVIGVDDTQPNRLQLYPRMPYDWNEIAVEKYPVVFGQSGKMETALMDYKLERSSERMTLKISSDKDLGAVATRLGPFEKRPEASSVRVNGKTPADTSIQHSGDSWWVRFTIRVGPAAGVVER